MRYPAFFDAVPRLRLYDPLAEFLGAVEDGVIEYGYADAVRLAGHSCPTVASAYGMTRAGLAALWGEALPERGAIRVEFAEARQAGVAGVIANVVALLTGATEDTGFKGLAGRFDRRDLMAFSVRLPLQMRLARVDTGAAVDVGADLSRVPGDPAMPVLLGRCLEGEAGVAERLRFGQIWQDRVRRILLDHGDDPAVFIVRPAATGRG